jgi:hypothetical protein
MGLTMDSPSETDLDRPSVEERRALIERVAASEHFRRSARLRDFLLYVGKQSLKSGHPEINEQEIGTKVFGRSASYDRSQDNIVRVNATELRKRIELYFAAEGAHETLILEIPRGGYKPVFHRRSASVSADPQSSPTDPYRSENPHKSAATGVPATRNGYVHLVWGAVTFVLLLTCSYLFQQDRTMRQARDPWQGKPAIASFWGDFLRFHQQTDLVLPDDSVSLIEDITHRPVSLGDYLNRNYMLQIQSSDYSSDRKVDLEEIFNHNLVTFGGVRASELVQSMIPASSSPRLTLSRYYLADAIKRNNVILIGGKKANPWVHLFDDQLNFITDYDDSHSQAFVRNRNPKAGELAAYPVPRDPSAFFGYSVVAYLPNPGGTGNVIVLAGTDSDATSAAAEFLTSEDKLSKFRDSLHVQKLPYFEVLLKTSRLSGTSLSSELISYRTHPELHQ